MEKQSSTKFTVREKALKLEKKGDTGSKNLYIPKRKSYKSYVFVLYQIKPTFFSMTSLFPNKRARLDNHI